MYIRVLVAHQALAGSGLAEGCSISSSTGHDGFILAGGGR